MITQSKKSTHFSISLLLYCHMGARLVAFLSVCWCWCDTDHLVGAEERIAGYIKYLALLSIRSVHILPKLQSVERLHKLNFAKMVFDISIKNSNIKCTYIKLLFKCYNDEALDS